MKDDELPRIPSFEELGISPEELEELERELAESGEDPSVSSAEAGAGEGSGSATPPPPKKPRRSARSGLFKRSKKKGPDEKGLEGAKGGGGAASAKALPGAAAPKRAAPAIESEGVGGAAREPSPKRPGPSPLGGFRGPLTFVLLLVGAWFSSSARAVPAPLSSAAPDSAFSAGRAMLHVDRIAQAAHPPGSPEHERVRAYLLETLTGLGLEPAVQTTTEIVGQGNRARAATVRNVLTRLPGTASTGTVLVTAHYDGRELARAAGDDGSGVATILESLRALRTGPALRNDLIVLLTDAEELGLIGARAFVNQHPWMAEVDVVLSIEMRGGGGPSIMFETGAQNGWILGALRDADPGTWANSMTYEAYKRLPNDTDFTPFKEAGRQGLNFAAIGRAHVYHQTYDSPENLSPGTVQHHGDQALAMLRELGNRELGAVHAPDLVYFTLPFVGLVTYRPLWAYAHSAVIGLLLVVLLVVCRRFGARWAGIALGLVATIAVGGMGYGMGWGLLQWLPRFHPELGSLHGSAFHSEGWYVLALVGACLLLTVAVFGIARRWASPAELALGAVTLPAVAAVAAGAFAPMAAANLQWPALAGLVASAVVLGVPAASRPGVLRWLALLVLAVPVLVFLVPITELLWVAMTFRLAPGLGIMIVCALLLFLPLLDVMREPNGWWPAGAALVLGGAFLAVGLILARPSASRPAPSTLIYALDRGTGEAVWATDPVSSDAAYDPARAWAATRVGEFADSASLVAFGAGGGSYATAAARVVDVTAPRVQAVPPGGEASTIQLVLASGIGAEMMRVRIGNEDGRIVAVNGRPLPNDERVLDLEHWGTPDGDLVVDLETDRASELQLELVEHLLRPEELLGPDPFRRPPGLAPDITRRSDRAMLLTRLVVDPATGSISAPASFRDEPEEPGSDALVPDTLAPTGDSMGTSTPAQAPGGEPDSIRPDTVAVPDTVLGSDTVAVPDTASPPDTVETSEASLASDTRTTRSRPGS